ncbi:alpha/beta fold hydrolase [Agrobacterium tumefaciens]|uniref:alpha/beta hydrolase n=1 Tax=Agrobacterium tumefaciens TaxID=358 RepID=UPI0015717D23|nr:alpha/beta fold hydrolase [Agrobacterium tumefaciens]MCZ7497316.1 alpha/beta fold hydrolase [Rhizobium rhizogenes]NTE56530.1 alpha/beta fold hydrolase [Agrobacterium tumefaciens]NTE74498.1 alpha/beta fold hydrolase [Agrobacterium tumefaciens]
MVTFNVPLRLGVPPAEARVLCVFIHGRTQTPEDMRQQVVGRLKTDGVAFVLPHAAGNSWYDARAVDPLTNDARRQLQASLTHVRDIVAEFAKDAGRPVPILVGGFSQGACLTLEYAMKYGPWDGAMVNLTGCRVGTAACDRPFADLDRMPVYLTGSDKDPWIPVDAFAGAAEALGKARAELRCDLFPDRAHEASDTEVAQLDEILSALAIGRKPFQPLAG